MLNKKTIILILLTSCGVSSSSKLNHEWAKLRRDANNSMTSKCSYKEIKADKKKKAVLKKASAYLKKIAKHISDNAGESLEKEGLQTPFSDKFAFDNFCFEAQDTNKINAFASPVTGNIFAELKIIQLAENDAQVATFMGHEMAHVLMAHFSDYITPTKRKEELGELVFRDMDAIVKRCYKPSAFVQIKKETLVAVLGKTKKVETVVKELQEYLVSRFGQIFGAKHPLQGIINCGFIAKRQRKLVELFAEGDKVISTKPENLQNTWKRNREYLYKFVDDEQIQEAYKAAEEILKNASGEFEDGADSLLNWKEQEADEVGMELIYRSGFDIREAPKFWYNMMAANKIDAEQCLKDISEGTLEPRGKGTHPHPCYRYNDLNHKETTKHLEEYKKRDHLKKEIFEGELKQLQKEIKAVLK